uniref:Uncharacterized protein n=1 Tax=Anguilla anguilla TaxID=7936 RepID=A0A0E9QTR5_ANGAN
MFFMQLLSNIFKKPTCHVLNALSTSSNGEAQAFALGQQEQKLDFLICVADPANTIKCFAFLQDLRSSWCHFVGWGLHRGTNHKNLTDFINHS